MSDTLTVSSGLAETTDWTLNRRRWTEAPAFTGTRFSRTGVSDESFYIVTSGNQIRNYYYTALSFPRPLEIEFQILALQWKFDTMFASSIQKIISHPAYRRIIGKGWEVVPLILENLRHEPAMWFDALMSITGAQPVRSRHAGDIEAMSNDWIQWGIENGIIR
jgi:hypothetical protein